MLKSSGLALLAGALTTATQRAAGADSAPQSLGAVIGEPTAAKAGMNVLENGGNAVDAIVASALVAAVVSPHNCGIGGYGGCATLALARTRKITAIDFNTIAPVAARPDMFPLDDKGNVRNQANDRGWLASGVPGTMAGLEHVLQQYGTRTLRETLQPALQYAREGFAIGAGTATAIQNTAADLRLDAGSTRLLLRDGKPLKAGEVLRNPELAKLLEKMAADNSTEDFYHGDIAKQIAEAFRSHGGLVTARDLANYRVRELKPLHFDWLGHDLYTVPLTAGGVTVLETLAILKALKWERQEEPLKTHHRLEALRAAWHDRLNLLGDPEQAGVKAEQLYSKAHALDWVKRIEAAVRSNRPLVTQAEARPQGGTIHLSAVDRWGNFAALTLTHGNSFGARVTVEGLGLTLGHGMSRFESQPGHPNSVAPGKRPLHNMCPFVVTRNGKAVIALGGAGGRRIPNSVLDVLLNYLPGKQSLEQTIKAPRMHCEGDLNVKLEKEWPEATREHLRQTGFKVETGGGARISAVEFNPKSGAVTSASR